jgi:hypothetical protein
MLMEDMREILSTSVPPALQEIYKGCMSLDAWYRYGTAGAAAAQLRQFLHGVEGDESDPGIQLAEEHLMAWRLGARIGAVANWHEISQSLGEETSKDPNAGRESMRWIVTRGLGFDISVHAKEANADRRRQWEADEKRNRRLQTPEFQALDAEAAVLVARQNEGATLDELESARLNEHLNSVIDFSGFAVPLSEQTEAIHVGLELISRLGNGERITRKDVKWLRGYIDNVKGRVQVAHHALILLVFKSDEDVRAHFECASWAAECCSPGRSDAKAQLLGLWSVIAGVQEEAKQFLCRVLLHHTERPGNPIIIHQELEQFYRAVDQDLVRKIPYDWASEGTLGEATAS